jgi:hypothetical protein
MADKGKPPGRVARGGPPSAKVFSPPTPKVSRQKPGRVMSPAERAAFLASRPDLKPKG